MKFVFLFLGKTREKYLEAGIKDYQKRLNRFIATEIITLKEKHSKKSADKTVKQNDCLLLLEQSKKYQFKIALDPTGKQPDSFDLANSLEEWENRGIQSVCFLIGGHLGLDKHVLDEANLVLSLSKLTFTHEMTRMILLEQLYRAFTIKVGHKYHK